MKKLFKIIPSVLLMSTLLSGCNKTFYHYEDKLYSEKTVFGEKELNTKITNVLTRDAAIKKALDIFDKSLNIKIDRTKFTENIKLIKNDSMGNLQWNITWYKDYGKIFYRCILDSSTSNIVQLQWFNSLILKNNTLFELSISEITDLIKPLLKQLQIDVNNYTLIPISVHTSNYMDIVLQNKKNHIKEYSIAIDLANKTVVSFEKINDQIKLK